MRIKKVDLPEITIITLMFLQLFILSYLGFQTITNKIIVALILFFYIIKKNKYVIKNINFILIVITFGLFLLSSIIGGIINFEILKSNFLMMFYPLMYTYFLSEVSKNKPKFYDFIANKMGLFFNVLLIINIIVAYVQVTQFKWIAISESSLINDVRDEASGLFMYGGTATLCMFFVLVTLYNTSIAKKTRSSLIRTIIIIYTFIMVVVSFWLSTLNDNKAVIIILPIYLLLYIYLGLNDSQKQKAKFLIRGCILLIALVIAYNTLDFVRSFVNEFYMAVFNMIYDTAKSGTLGNGSNERIGIISYFINNYSLWLVGLGWGRYGMYTPGVLGFYHFGQSSLGIILILGGISSLVFFFWTYERLLNNIVLFQNQNVNQKTRIIITILLLITALYNQCFSTPCLMFMICLIFMTFGNERN